MSGLPAAPGASRQLPINLFTRSGTDAIPASTYFIPSDWRRFQLSELINNVLQNTPENGRKPVPFDFLVNGEVLRGSLESWAKKNRGGDEESSIDVEYVRSVMPPEEAGRVEVEDWVSGLSLGRNGYILLSSYLSHLQILPLANPSSTLYTLPLPTSLGATSCAWVSPSSQQRDILLAAGSVDRQTHVFSIPSLSHDETSAPREIYTLHGHTGPVSDVIASKSGSEIVSASWDGSVNLYALPNEEPTEHQLPADPVSYLPGQDTKKRRKLEKSREKDGEEKDKIEGLTDLDATGEGGWRRTPDITLRAHTGRVGALVWDKLNDAKLWSAGWDGSLREWDVQAGGVAGQVRQGPFDKSLLGVDMWAVNGVIATGSMDRTVCLWDTRQATSLISLTLPTTSPVPSVTCHPTSPFTLASATYSGLVQIWDIRSPKSPLFTVSKAANKAASGEARTVTKNGKVLGERLLSVDWDGDVLVAGGEDGEVGVWRARGE
ncbi:ribosome biogenesis protein YTM1 [Cryptococcus amylolentus CBS 6273]|uniref:Ribosome biogenesis protein YTM1 n=1 Tax=Cryptococcus amylolentus CBS 6273 TaxID=1296118 RepID=A0A1E3JJC0_9TREE|nr:ribosome biogenesis protein YTM1 [Cryptococcus amylolentus CBS 6273]